MSAGGFVTRGVEAAFLPRLRSMVKSLFGRFSVTPPVGFVRFGSLRRTSPIAPIWPPRYGRPVDRHYIDAFFEQHATDLRGEVLEVGGPGYTNRFGGDGITGTSTLHAPVGAGPNTTYVADLVDAPALPSEHFDCIVLPQTLLFIYDVRAAVQTLCRILKPGGVLLATVPGITQTVPDDRDKWGQYWSFTEDSLLRLFGDEFGPANIAVEPHGNVLTTIALLHGLAVEDLRPKHFEPDDPHFPLILTVRAVRDPHR